MSTRKIRLLFPALCTGLGTWQLYRLQWKRQLLADIDKGLSQEPITVENANIFENVNVDYRILRLEGFTVDENAEPIVVGPRSSKSVLPDVPFGSIVIRRILDRHGNAYLLNDGWIPWKASVQDYYPPANSKSILAVLDRTERPSWFAAGNDPALGKWRWKVINELAQKLGTRPIMFKRIQEPGEACEPTQAVPSKATFEIPNRHLEYVMTWYGLAVATFLMSFLKR